MRALVPIADGSEEIEAVCIIDTLRRAGMDVFVASVDGPVVVASRGVKLGSDGPILRAAGASFDVIALPGGMPGAERLAADATLGRLLRDQHAAGRLIGALCAAPAVVLQPAGILDGRRATAHPAFADRIAHFDPAAVVRDGHVITSRGPGTAIVFALEIIRVLLGNEKAVEVAGPMMV